MSFLKQHPKKSIAILLLCLIGYWGFGKLWHANTLNMPWAKPLNWAKGKPITGMNFYTGSATYAFSDEGKATGFLLIGPYQASFDLTSSPVKRIGGAKAYQGIPKGKIVAFWHTYTRPQDDSDRERHYYYAASPADETFQLPPRPGHHWAYEMYAFFGQLKLFEEGLDKQRFSEGKRFVFSDGSGREPFYQVGNPSSFYYFFRHHPADGDPERTWTQNKVWHEIEGIEISKAQYDAMWCDSINEDRCTPFLTENTPGLTPEQLDYVKKHPITKADFADLIEVLDNIPVNRWK